MKSNEKCQSPKLQAIEKYSKLFTNLDRKSEERGDYGSQISHQSDLNEDHD